MRLLHISNGSFSLVERVGNDIPRYAVLSHTWGSDDDEVSSGDLMVGVCEYKPGWHKIKFCGQQAAKDGLDYFWVDTCCIQKISSAELTEAINSMFHWYQDAARCYVYLSDVSKKESAEDGGRTWASAFRDSRWFSRGWTLQELLAPRSVEFFSVEGTRLGDKKSLKNVLQDITGIDSDALQGIPLSRYSIPERMSWAAGRETKRPEDAAYSLLGIFDIHMPLIYGEGQHKALKRLQKELEGDYSTRLPIAVGASFDSHMQEHNAKCLADTRSDLLHHISNWAIDRTSKPIFWLNGMAGTGKSTVARTIARSFADQNQLGASFFFKRGESQLGNATRFFTTVATELMASMPEMRPGIKEALELDEFISEKTLKDQFEKLILKPLLRTSRHRAHRRIIVIDALDECERDEDIREILRLLFRIREMDTTFLRVFVTSRPELHIRLGFKQMSNGEYENIILHEIPEDVVKHDMKVLLRHEFAEMRKQRSLPSDWPSRIQIQALVDLSAPLFVFAASACRYIGDPKQNPRKRLETILTNRGAKASKLDETYLPILNLLFEAEDEDDKEQWIADFRAIVGSIVVLQDPLSINALANLLDVSKFDIGCRLDSLHSVFNIPDNENEPIRFLHLSLREFLVDPQKQGRSPLWIDKRKTNEEIATRCLHLMRSAKGLRRNICNLRLPSTLVHDVDSRDRNRNLPPELRYACCYWTHHLQESECTIRDGDVVHSFLQKHFIHWVEAMSLMGKSHMCNTILEQIISLVDVTRGSAILTFLRGAKHFVIMAQDIIKETVLQLYFSALVLAPDTSVIRKTFAHYTAQSATRLSSIEGEASDRSHLVKKSAAIQAVVFSHNGELIATASIDHKLQLWSAATGARQKTIEGHSDWISAVLFSPNDRTLASPSYDASISLWSTETDKHYTLRGHERAVNAITFTKDSEILVSVSDDMTIRLWDVHGGSLLRVLTGHVRAVNAIALSKDDSMLASASDDCTIRLWKKSTGTCRTVLYGHTNRVLTVVFSPCDRLLASTSTDRTIRVWNIQRGTCKHILTPETGWANPPIFSLNSKYIAAVSRDKTMRFFDVSRGKYRGTLNGFRDLSDWGTSAAPPQGEVSLRTPSRTPWSTMLPPEEMHRFTLFVAGKWVVYKGRHVMRLPEKCEQTCTAVKWNVICIGHASGEVTLLRFGEGEVRGVG
ncbi:vegetative incompatibility protein HET-E-1 [Setomelanomma holmii]|uniref:Vegetative incompatibility protein HET-E-1 n=1 Tax=Setomelanomma holmii TaxID=210430 RepID=A0A9P4GYN4_9PLEO|nr:vegetative incompatibility protein HET-E-1 [Setomelanomma holmii]